MRRPQWAWTQRFPDFKLNRLQIMIHFYSKYFWHPILLTPNTSDTRFLRPSNSSVFCRHKLGVLQFNSDTNHLELVKSPQFESSFPQDCPHFRVSFVSEIRFDNSAQNCYLRLLVYYKGCNAGTAKQKRCPEQSMLEGRKGGGCDASAPSLGTSPSQHLDEFPKPDILQTLFRSFTKVLL